MENSEPPDVYPGTSIRRVNWTGDLETIRRFFVEYRQWLADHQGTAESEIPVAAAGLASIDAQIRELPGAYGPPLGEVLLAFAGGEVTACGALRPLEPSVGEIKRLYIRADHRGGVFGHRFTSALIERARELGYARVRADTLPTMKGAIQFYEELGFERVSAYWPHPVPDAVFFEYRITRSGA